MKRTFSEIVIILAFSISLALFFNYLDPDGIDIFSKKQETEIVNDDELFGNQDIKIDTIVNKNIEQSENKQEFQTSTNVSDNEPSKEVIEETHKENETESPHNSDANEHNLKTVTYSQMQKIAKDTSFIIIDARSPELFEEDRIGNAINIFPFADDQAQVVEQIFQLPYGKKIVVYCDGGTCDASHLVAEMLIQFDYKDIYLYSGGWEEWIKNR